LTLLKPGFAISRASFAQQHIHERVRLVSILNGELHQTAGIGMDGGLTQL